MTVVSPPPLIHGVCSLVFPCTLARLSELLRVNKDEYYKEAAKHAGLHALAPPAGASAQDLLALLK